MDVRNAIAVTQFDHLFREQPEAPIRVPLGRRPQPQRDDLRFLLAVEPLGCGGRRAFGPVERLLEPPLDQPLADVFHGLGAAGERFGDPLIGPDSPQGLAASVLGFFGISQGASALDKAEAVSGTWLRIKTIAEPFAGLWPWVMEHFWIVAMLSASFVSSVVTPAIGQQPSAIGETASPELPSGRRHDCSDGVIRAL